MAKPRKKKPANGRIQQQAKEISSIVNICYQSIWIIGDSRGLPRAMGIQTLWTHISKTLHEFAMNEFLRLLYSEKEWSLGLFCVFRSKDNPDEYEVGSALSVIEESTASEVSTSLSDVINKTIDVIKGTDESFTDDRFVYYCYFLEPENNVQSHVRLTRLIDVFINIVGLDKLDSFVDGIPKIVSDENTLPLAIKNNGLLPKKYPQNYIFVD